MADIFSKYLFFLKPVNSVVLVPFGWVLVMLLVFAIPFLRSWWWVFAPVVLASELRTLYLWWINWDYAYRGKKWIVLEIITPKEILTPLKAMEDVFTTMWGPLYGTTNWREKYCDGDLPTGTTEWMSCEIVSTEGALHYYIRVAAEHRPSLEAILYAHYPELEIREVPDYTKNVPQNVPSEEWDTYGEDFILGVNPAYPIKTYEKFFEPAGEKISAEEKRIDPISSVLEMMAKLGPGEHFWMQFITVATDYEAEPNFLPDGREIINKLAKRSEKKEVTLWQILIQTARDLILGPEKEGDTYSWPGVIIDEETGEREMVLTPGEREIVTEIETKAKKPIFRCSIRGVYVARRDRWKSSNKILTRSYFGHFQTQNLNYLRYSTTTRPKTHYVFRKRIPFLRARRMFRNYVNRFPSFFPDRQRECPLLNGEELATIYHFPLKISGLVFPTMTRVEHKKGGPPLNLPVEE